MSKIAKETFIEKVKDEYIKGDSCMADLLAIIKPSTNMTMDECFTAYCELMYWSDDDAFLQVNEDDNSCIDVITNTRYKYDEVIIKK